MLKRIRVTGFKSLNDVTVDLDPVTVIVGRSGSGKTNFVEAIRLLRDILTARNSSPIDNHYGGWRRIISATIEGVATLSFEVTFTVEGLSGEYSYFLSYTQKDRNGQGKQTEEWLKYNGSIIFHSKDKNFITNPNVNSSLNPETIALGSISGVQEIAIANVALTTGIACYDFPGTVFQTNKTTNPRYSGLEDTGQNYIEAFNAIETNLAALNNWQQIIASLATLDPSISSVQIKRPERDKIAISHKLGEQLLTLDIDQESEGIRRFLIQLIALYQTPTRQTLIFEEPEKGVHPGALSTLAEQFLACPSSKRGQIIITTHSPEFLDRFSAEQLRVAEINNHKTTIGPLVKDQADAVRERLMTTGELLTVNKARVA